jgi:uncharacterized membrane protein YbhN (UPF0104 family)
MRLIHWFNDLIYFRELKASAAFVILAIVLIIPQIVLIALSYSPHLYLLWWAQLRQLQVFLIILGFVSILLAVYCRGVYRRRLKRGPSDLKEAPHDLRYEIVGDVRVIQMLANKADAQIVEPPNLRRCKDCDTALIPPEFDDVEKLHTCPYCHIKYTAQEVGL